MRAHPAGPRHAEVLDEHDLGPAPEDLAALAPALWPHSATRVDGVVQIGGIGLDQIAAEHGTPAFVLDAEDFRARARQFCTAFAGADVYYAAKAFLSRRIARWVAEEGLSLDASTGGELETALAADFPPERIAFHGNNKSANELTRALQVRVGRVVLDSFDEIALLSRLTAQAGVTQRVLIRATVGVEAHTHEYIATAHEDQKFGFSVASGAALDAVARVLAAPGLELVGVHSHIGSQIFDTAGFEVSAHRVVALLAQIRDTHGVALPEIGLGGGMGIAYRPDDDPLDIETVAASLVGIVKRECAAAQLPLPRMSVEPGRAIAGPGTLTLYTVGTVKDVDGLRTYVSVDGGMSDNIRTALYGAEYTCVLANRVSTAEPMRARVVGKHCESGDIVVRDTYLPGDLVPGDLIAVAATGAYCRSMASNYNHVLRPPVISVAGGRSETILRRETVQDLLGLDLG